MIIHSLFFNKKYPNQNCQFIFFPIDEKHLYTISHSQNSPHKSLQRLFFSLTFIFCFQNFLIVVKEKYQNKHMSIDPSNPLAALLAQHTEDTVLDRHFNKVQQHKNDQIHDKSNDDDDDDDDGNVPIALNIRQPSFTSLHGELVTKAGKTVTDLADVTENDAIVVLDDHNDSENVPIGLSYRQPSFSSMTGHLVGKGGDSLDHISPVQTIPIEEIPEDTINEDDEDDDANDDDCREVKIVKELRNKNRGRWEQMGYEPPKNLIQLTREASQNQFNQQNILASTAPLKNAPPIIEEIPETPKEEKIEKQKENSKVTPKHRRCGSNGMKLGEASTSLARMSQALMITDTNENAKTKQNVSNSIPEEGYEDYDEDAEEEEAFEEEDAETSDNWELEQEGNYTELYGRLGKIVKEPKDSAVYIAILNNSVSHVKKADFPAVKSSLEKILEKSIDNIWIEETSYINNLLSALGDSMSRRNSPKKDPNEASEIQTIRTKQQRAQQKYNDLIQSEKIKYKTDLQQLMDNYHSSAAELDAKYQSDEMINKFNKPSRALIQMRERVKQMLRNNQIELAKKENASIKHQEEKEAKANSRELREKYYQADRRLKELYAGKREILYRKYRLQIQQIEKKKTQSKRKYENLIQRAKDEQTRQKNTGRLSSSSSKGSLDKSQYLKIKAPKPLNRSRDDQLLEAMSSEIDQGKDVGKLDIDALFRKSAKTPGRYSMKK